MKTIPWAGGRFFFVAHVGLSVLLSASICLVVFLRWYPGGLFELQGGRQILLWTSIGMLVLGPFLSAMVLRSRSKGRKELCFDLTVIIVLQAMAFGYGAWVLSLQRAEYLVFLHDRFFVITPRDVIGAVPKEVSESNRWLSGPRPVFVKLSLGAQLEIDRTIQGMIEAPPMALLAGAYAPLQEGVWRFEQIIAEGAKVSPDNTLRVPIVGRVGSATALIDSKSGELIRIE